MNDNEIIKALECCCDNAKGCEECPFEQIECITNEENKLIEVALDLINSQKAEIERLQKLQKPTETSGFKIQNGKVVFYSNMLNGYRHEYENLDEVVKELNLMLQSCYKCDEVVGHYKGNLKIAKSEAYREFALKVKMLLETKAVLYSLSDRDCEFAINQATALKAVDTTLNELTRNLHGTCTESNE